MSRRAALALAAVLAACSPRSESDLPRGAILVVVDTLRADHLGAYGSTWDLTPRLDQLASESTVFRQARAASSWTRPSVASMLTGQHPTTLDVLDKDDVLSDSVETLAETLANEGVLTVGISTNGNAGRRFGFAQGFQHFVDRLPKSGLGEGYEKVVAETVTGEALARIDSLDSDRPFFLFVHYIDPHEPYLPRPDHLPGPEPPGRFDGSLRQLRRLDRLPPEKREPDDLERIRHLYRGEVAYADHWLGVLLDGLQERGLLDNTLLLLTSDHGEGLWDHGTRAHGHDLYEEMIAIPLIARFPADSRLEPGPVDGFVHHTDLAPTMLEHFGLPPSPHSQGRPLQRLLARNGLQDRLYGYTEMRHIGIDLEAITDGTSKLVRDRRFDNGKGDAFEYTVQKGENLGDIGHRFYGKPNAARDIYRLNRDLERRAQIVAISPPAGTVLHMPARERPPDSDFWELYDLRADGREIQDLSSEGEAAASELAPVMEALAGANAERSIDGETLTPGQLDDDTRQRLRALGYLD